MQHRNGPDRNCIKTIWEKKKKPARDAKIQSVLIQGESYSIPKCQADLVILIFFIRLKPDTFRKSYGKWNIGFTSRKLCDTGHAARSLEVSKLRVVIP